MHIAKLRVSSEATGRLRMLSQRSGLTPNLLCRMALASSLETGPIGDMSAPEENGQEFNAYTLFGSDQPIFLSLLSLVEETEADANMDDQELLRRLRCHIDRGIGQIAVRISTPSDAARLLSGIAA
ncbi:DNA sulfur modification protein DndE [Pseudaestuariivita atlantica]|uniref:DNA sulfur modification protein DndE n=1 Tax=Pseudaestuariivita atlantica TaxID=1317121 RepID=A0A0L1JJ33_9RHOB|nr:DNA sulfur modification protein DndE [Pseudaestuariivita atlantica]KNG91774.1 DNA sulfur modification protein DndE [Pseudaestuariivita atlantica]